jgi:hypothetical protein
MTPFRRTQLALLILSLGACGKAPDKIVIQARPLAEGDLQAASELLISGTLSDGGATALRSHSIKTSFRVSDSLIKQGEKSLDESIEFKASLYDADEKLIWEQTQTGKFPMIELEWAPQIEAKEGFYSLEVVAKGKAKRQDKEIEYTLAKKRMKFELDTTQPALSFSAKLGAIGADGERSLALEAVIANESSVTCSDAGVSHLNTDLPLKIKVEKTGSENRRTVFANPIKSYAELPPSNNFLKLNCRDAAGNQSELAQVISVEGRNAFGLRATVDAKVGAVFGAAASDPMQNFLSSTLLKMNLELLDPSTSMPYAATIVEAEKATMRVYLTETPLMMLEELKDNKGLIWTQNFATSLSIPLPSSYLGAKKLYLTLVNHDTNLNKDVILGSQTLNIFIDNAGPNLTLAQDSSFSQPSKNQSLKLNVNVAISGAPIDGQLIAEYSTDAVTWTALPYVGKTLSPGVQELSFGYPLDRESPFKVRITAKDLAGNAAVSKLSRELLGSKDLALAVPAAERTGCVSGSSPGSKLKFWLAHSFSCKREDATGQLSGSSLVSLLVQNRGQVKPLFYSAAQIPAALGYRVVGDGVTLKSGDFSEVDPFKLDSAQGLLLHLPLVDSWLSAKRLEVIFDIEETDAYSTTNGCYTASEPYPTIVLYDKTASKVLATSPFACDPDTQIPILK